MKVLIIIVLLSSPALAEVITIEAESGALVAPMTAANGYIQTIQNEAGSVQLNFTAQGGTYYIWGLVEQESTGGSNSFYISANSGTRETWGTPLGETAWVWDRVKFPGTESPIMFALTKGQNYIELFGRESYSKIDALILTDDPNYVPGDEPLLYERTLGSTVNFGWDWSPSFVCMSCDSKCQNCYAGNKVTIPIGTTSFECNSKLFSVSWNWPKATVTGGCGGSKTYTYWFKFRGIREDGVVVFQGITADLQVPIQFLFGEGVVRFEVAATEGDKQSDYATGLTDGLPGPWLVQAVINNPTDFLFE